MARCYRVTFMCAYADGTLVEPSLHYLTDVPTAGDAVSVLVISGDRLVLGRSNTTGSGPIDRDGDARGLAACR